MTHRMEVLIWLMSRRVKRAHLLIAKVKKRIWPVKRPLAMAVEGENSWSNGLVLLVTKTLALKYKKKRGGHGPLGPSPKSALGYPFACVNLKVTANAD